MKMSTVMIASDAATEDRRLDKLAWRVSRAAALVGLLALAASVLVGLLQGAWLQFFRSYLVNFCFFLSLALGALFFVLLQHLTRAGWSVVVRRLAEIIAATLPVLVVLFIPLVLGMHHVYHWTHADAVAHDELLRGKRAYLNVPFWVGRCLAYFAVWVGLARYLLRRSLEQDATGDVRLTLRMQRISGPAMVLFGLTLTFASFDLLMSLDPHWFSTIFGVYYFSGSAMGFFALLVVAALVVQRAGRLKDSITPEHYHDLGKLVFAFVVFWAYIAFSQYMLIWYANIPEETSWYLSRQTGHWAQLSLVALVGGHFIVPFLALLSRYPKRRSAVLLVGAVWVLLMHWIDLYWLATPSALAATAGRVPLNLLDGTCFVGIGGLFVAAAAAQMRQCAMLPVRDPRLSESLAFENV